MSVKTSIYDFSNFILLIGIPINLFDSLFTVYDKFVIRLVRKRLISYGHSKIKEPQASIESFSYIRAAAIFEESPLSS